MEDFSSTSSILNDSAVGCSYGTAFKPPTTLTILTNAIPLPLITSFIILGNTLVIIAFISHRSLRTPPNAYLVSLAIVDLCVGILVLPWNITLQVRNGKWTFGATSCKLWLTADITLCTVSIFHLIAIAVDRYRSVTDGIVYVQNRTMSDVIAAVCFIWVLALWISSPPILGWNNWDELPELHCKLARSKGYVFHSAIGSFILPIILMIVLYTRIYSIIKQKLRKRTCIVSLDPSYSNENALVESSNGSIIKSGHDILIPTMTIDNTECKSVESEDNRQSNKDIVLGTEKDEVSLAQNELPEEQIGNHKSTSNTLTVRIASINMKPRSRPSSQIAEFVQKKIKFSLTKERRAVKTLGIIIGAFIICWVPFCVFYIIEPHICFCAQPGSACETTELALTWLGYCNSAINPIIYTVFNLEFRKAFRNMLRLDRM